MPLQLNFKLLKPTSSSQGAGARSIDYTACGCTQRSLPCDKKVVIGNGWGSSFTGLSVSSQLTTFTLAGHPLSSFQWPSCPHRAHGSFCLSLSSLALRSSDD